ncbi:hypothetical protein TWF106_009148 [Orbilia oligospora]|uniref:Uncharacterized protein n=2 Tax=Orbilia oligospora TaxID=2813651 RepID=A0A7C8R090_ORBOL|nr:hypothetical protein TWF106_009148 [Orbilia oligospora]
MMQMDPKKSILNVLPVEITILIARHMTRSARENFSRCSVLCYQICFSLRFSPRIILTPDSISLFKDGGVCEPVRRSIRSIRFLSPYFLDTKIRRQNHIVNFADLPDYSFEFFITQIRIFISFLSLFPNIHELYIYYHVPLACEFNVYAAILKRICMAGRPTRKTLRRLEIQFHKNSAPNIDGPLAYILRGLVTAIYWLFSWNKSTASPAPMSYQDLYSALSSENRAFLGKEIEEGELKEFGPKLSSLKTATIWARRSTTLLDEDNIGIFERSRFYTASLATAPELDTLYVKNEVLRDSQDKVDACQIEQLGEQLGTKFCDEVSLIEYLGITHVRPEIPEDQIATLFDRKHGSDFSYHIDSDISQSSAHSAPARAKGLSDRNGVSHDDKFKKLGRSISPNQLKTVVDGLTGVGSDHLPIIEVEGVRFREGQSDLVRTSLSVQRTRKEGGLKMKSTIAPAQYVGFRSRYVDPDYVENPAAYICRVVIIYGLIVVLSKVVSIRLETYFMV